nr:two-component system QseEF-associated lipoprotein QseG [Pantoea sp. 201603H]
MKWPFLCPFGRVAVIALPFLLVACAQQSHRPLASHLKSHTAEPEMKITDYLSVRCERVWQFSDDDSMKNPLYWLRAMDCAGRMSPAEARAEARNWSTSKWEMTLKQSVLLSHGNVTPLERRQYIQHLDRYSYDFPSSIRTLLQLWRDNQMAQLQLSAERSRYASLQRTSDEQLDALRRQQQQLSNELAITRRKLATLTDIERQLSTRKSSDVSDNNHGPEKESRPVAVEAGDTYLPGQDDKNSETTGAENP